MKKLILLGLLLALIPVIGHADLGNWMAKNWGGSSKVVIAKGEQVIGANWKEGGNLWALIKLPSGEVEFREFSVYGVIQGKVLFTDKQ